MATKRELNLADAQNFSEFVNNLVNQFKALVSLNKKAGALKQGLGRGIEFNHNGRVTDLYTRDINSLNTLFGKELKRLNGIVKVGFTAKKPKAILRPEDMKGIYGPVFAGDDGAIAYFLQNGNFGLINPNLPEGADIGNGDANVPLVEALGVAGQGYFLRNAVNILFYIHLYADGLQDRDRGNLARSSQAMMDAFGGDIPARYVKNKIGTRTVNKKGEFVEEDVYERIANTEGLNTFQAVQQTHPDFDPELFPLYYLQSMSSINIYKTSELSCDPGLAGVYDAMLNNQEVRQAMLNDHELVSYASDGWRTVLEPERKRRADAKKAARKAAEAERKAAEAAALLG